MTPAQAIRRALAAALCSLGEIQERRLKRPHAVKLIEAALGIAPDYAQTHYAHGNLLSSLDRLDEAAASYRKALALKPDYAEAHHRLGNTLRDLDRNEEAIASCHKALAIRPDFARTHASLGMALHRLGHHQEAIASFQKSLAIKADDAPVRFNHGLMLLALGNYADGWKEYEWRWAQKEFPLPNWNFAQPRWQGNEDLSARTILLHAEQGLGDTLQFVRYAPLVAARGARVIVACQAPLKRLLARLDGVEQVIGIGEPWPDFDLHCPLSSLPLAFATNLTTIPATIPYLDADPADVMRWKARIGDSSELKVGLVWAGASRGHNARLNRVDQLRSIALARFWPLAKVDGVRYFSLQKGKSASQARYPPHPMALLDFTGDLHDFADTAALVAQLDLVITVDTSVAHLAGAMGKPVWILSRFHGCWRWLLDRDDSPWYPTARLFRQPKLGDWDSVMERVREELMRLVQTRGS